MAKPFGGNGPPAALFHDSRDRGGTHPWGHPAGWSGILQADAYAGFNGLYAKGRAPAPLTEASCWAHGGARFFELADLAKAMRAPMVIEAVRRIDGNRRRPWSSPAIRHLTRFQDIKTERGLIDYNDMEQFALRALDEPAVAERFEDELELLLVDEFQYTNPMQLWLFMKLAQFAREVVLVGDVKQAIYGFRGSDPELVPSTLDALATRGCTVDMLESSWRSCAT